MTLAVRRTLRSIAAAAFLGAATHASALCQTPQALVEHTPSIATTKHTGVFGGRTVAYTATVEEHILDGSDGIPNAFLVTIAYVRDSVASVAKRPVAFVFNGGPGASSSPLHFNGIGPRLGTRDGNAENPNSVLDAIDLVFIDPVGTGFSRPYTTEIGKQYYWNLSGDAASVAQVIGAWLHEHNRDASPRYMIGESYGTTRIGEILRSHKELTFDGVVLISAVGGSENVGDLRYIKNVPSMAVGAWYHERVPHNGRTVDQVWAEALAFIDAEYRPALARGGSLSADQKRTVAARMSALVGLPATFIEGKNLRLSAQDWLLTVLEDKGLRVSNQDTRATGPLVLSPEQAATSSPAEGLGGMRIGTAMQAPALVAGVDPAPTSPSPRSPLENVSQTGSRVHDARVVSQPESRHQRILGPRWRVKLRGRARRGRGDARESEDANVLDSGLLRSQHTRVRRAGELRASGPHRRSRGRNDGAGSPHRIRDRGVATFSGRGIEAMAESVEQLSRRSFLLPPKMEIRRDG